MNTTVRVLLRIRLTAPSVPTDVELGVESHNNSCSLSEMLKEWMFVLWWNTILFRTGYFSSFSREAILAQVRLDGGEVKK